MSTSDVIRKGKPFEDLGLTESIVQGLSSTVKLKRKNLYASDAAYCPRKASIIINLPEDYTSETSPSSALYMAVGSAVHEQIQGALKKQGSLIAAEFRISNLGISLGGYIDAIVNVRGEPTVLEIKTCGNLPSKPKPDHISQALTYSLVTGIENPIILYVSRNVAGWDGKIIMRAFHLEPSNEELEVIANNLFRAQIYSRQGMLAEVPAHIRKASDCGFCPFQQFCWGDASLETDLDIPTTTQREAFDMEANILAKELLAAYHDPAHARREETIKRAVAIAGGR